MGPVKIISHARKWLSILLACFAFNSCSHAKTMSRDELRSSILAAVSLASETEVFIDQLEEGRVTDAFAQGHLNYLSNEVMRSANELRQARTESQLGDALLTSRMETDSLAKTLSDLKAKASDAESLTATRNKVARIAGILLSTAQEL
jgi:hypothetical protein